MNKDLMDIEYSIYSQSINKPLRALPGEFNDSLLRDYVNRDSRHEEYSDTEQKTSTEYKSKGFGDVTRRETD